MSATSTCRAGRRCVAVESEAVERPGVPGAPGAGATAAPSAERGASIRGRLVGTILVVPGVAWLILFFVVPLLMIFVVSLGSRDALDRVVLDPLSLDNYRRAFDPSFLPTFFNSLDRKSV